jgi:methyl-accepting chemotaxis protein
MRVIQELADAAQQIGSITNTISALADQTNLLALNATIEAAHAGVAGRGFTIVASEVKDLSRQTHAAAQKIGEQITAMQSASSRSIEQIGTVLDRMQQIAQVTSAIAASVCEQEVATQAISEAVRQTAGASARASENVKAIETVVEKNVVAAEEMAAWASRLSHDSGELTVKVDAFFRRVREA